MTFIIAEAGVNHNGDINLARRLVDAAKEAGCDAVKFQNFVSEKLVNKTAPKAEYQKNNAKNKAESQLEMLKKLELSESNTRNISEYCSAKGIMFLSTPFDDESADLLNSLGVSIFKIPSGEITNLPYLRKIKSLGKPIILSTGMSTLEEVAQALDVLKGCEVSLLHCTTEYPCPYKDVNLKAMLTLKNKFGLQVGYSDHTNGIEVPVAAVAMGATIIEKHFTLDKTLDGPDHKASLDPVELKNMVTSIRNIEVALGSGEKKPSPSELKNILIARRSIVAKCPIKKGEIFTEENLTTKRPASGISPMNWDNIVGTISKKDYLEDEVI